MKSILYKVYYILKWIVLYHKLGSIPASSYMKRPMRLVNPRFIRIGKDVTILDMARMECVRQDGGRKLRGSITIGDGTSIEQCSHIIAADKLVIGKGVTISAFVYIADVGHGIEVPGVDVMKQPMVVKKTEICDGAFIGMGARIMPGVRVGKGAIVGANAVVTHSVPDYTVVAGVPAKPIKRYNPETKEWEKID
ncbi:MAG: acyltransferase [Eubacterium sp.]|nr:acyltransferase [Eubacterium sp.]